MGELSIDGQRISYEPIAVADADRRYALEIEYGWPDGTTTDHHREELSVSRRGDVTRELVENALSEWFDGVGNVIVRRYELVEEVECRRGELLDVERESPSLPEDKPLPGVDPETVTVGDRIAYYVDGPGSEVYGHLSEAVVEEVPPRSRSEGAGERASRAVLADVGPRTIEIPLAWIAGPVDDPEVAAAIDRPRPELGE